MAHQPHPKVIITCAITGNLTRPEQSPYLPITPQQIADSALEAADAGASIAHIHVRDPATKTGSMELRYYREVVERIRDSGTDIILNLTTGAGGMFYPSKENPGMPGPGTNMCAAEVRVRHVLELRPEICSLDLCTMWSRNRAFMNIPEILAEMARLIRSVGTLPELECFDTGDIVLAKEFLKSGVIEAPALFQLVLGINYGAPATPEAMTSMRNMLPAGSRWAAFGISRMQFPMLAQAVLLGGHVRVGLEDNHYLDHSVFADNAALVEKGVRIVTLLGGEVATPAEGRELLGLRAARQAIPA